MISPIIAISLLAGVMILVEILFRGRVWKKVRGWYPRAIALNIVQILIVYISSSTWSQWFQNIPLFHLNDFFSTGTSAFIGYFVITFVFYWWHRARHEIPFLWVKLHQIHHSAQRLEILTAFYKHPLEILINSISMSFILYCSLGLSPESAALTTIFAGLGELFYHWNIRTPHWLGYIIQRPESHCIHHKRNWHTQNYSDLPLWDIIFGTFNNPFSFDGSCGFKQDREILLKEMICGRDINPPKG